MRISELSALTGVSPHRLRHYESLGLIVSQRQPNGYRVFSSHTSREVVFIDMSRKMGFSLDEIDALIAEKKKLRQLLLNHIDWFHAKRKKPP